MRLLKAIGFNFLGAVVGIVAGNIAYKIASLILIDLLGKLGWLTPILSWPVPYYYYALTGIAAAQAAASITTASFFSTLANTKIRFCNIIVGLYGIITYISYLVYNLSENGFSFKMLFVFLIMISFFIFTTGSSLLNEDL